MTKTHDNRSAECSDPSCPCYEWSAKSPSESPSVTYYGHPRLDMGVDYPVSEAKNVLNGDSEPSSPIPAPCAASTFDREWASAPTVATRYTEQAIAEYWFLRGMRAEREWATELLNQDLHELVRLAGERLR